MKFFLDFEATRFSNRIISIGCVAENGATFETYVKPGDKKKVDKFITELTGITNEMLSEAPDADTAFRNLYQFIEDNSDGTEPVYYVYGNADADFLRTTARHMTDTLACMTAQAIAGNIIDYASVVKKYFVAKSDLALRKVYMLIQDEKDLVQKHDALEDARMLETVVAHLYDKCKPEDKDTILAMPSQKRPQVGNKAPAIFLSWDKVTRWEAYCNATKDNYVIKFHEDSSNQTKYFDSIETAALWLIKYFVRNKSPKNKDHVNKMMTDISNAIKNGKKRYGGSWELSAEGAIAATAKEENNG